MNNIGVVILNYNGYEDTIECVESLSNQSDESYQIIIVDNNSENDSYEKIKSWLYGDQIVYSKFLNKEFRKQKREFIELNYEKEIGFKQNIRSYNNNETYNCDKIVLINCDKNYGFLGGNNIGAKYVEFKNFQYVLLLNNDTIIIDNYFLQKLVSPFKSSENIFLTGPNTINFDGSFDSPMIEDTFLGNLFYLPILNSLRKLLKCPPVYIDVKAISSPAPVPVYKVSGACMMFDTKKLKEINYLDEGVWLSSEEAIISEKIKKKGGEIVFQPITTLIHKKAQSPRPKSDRYNILKNHYMQRDYFYRKYRNYGMLKITMIRLMTKLRLIIEKIR